MYLAYTYFSRTRYEGWTAQFGIMKRQINMRLAISLVLSISLLAQNSGVGTIFDVATLKRSTPGSPARASQHLPGRMDLRGLPLVSIISRAWGLTRNEIVVPDWMATERYDIQAQASSPLSDEQMKPLLQSLLIDRLGMKTHFEERKTPVYALIQGKGPLTKGDPIGA